MYFFHQNIGLLVQLCKFGMNLVHTLMEIDTIILLLSYANVGARGQRVVLFCYLLNGGDFAKTQHILVLAILAKLRYEPLTLAGCF